MRYKLWEVCASATHHTTDKDCLSCDVVYDLPVFAVFATDFEDAKRQAREIICPMADSLQYEAVTVTLKSVIVAEHTQGVNYG